MDTIQQPARAGVHGRGTGSGSGSEQGSVRQRASRSIGPIGTAARLIAGLLLVGNVAYGQLVTHHVRPATWALGLLGFPALVLAWHVWRIRRHPARFDDTSPFSYLLGALLFLALYLTWWYAPALSVTSDAALLFFGGTMVLTALLGYGGCELLTPSNWLLRRHDQIACAVFAPFDALDQRNACRRGAETDGRSTLRPAVRSGGGDKAYDAYPRSACWRRAARTCCHFSRPASSSTCMPGVTRRRSNAAQRARERDRGWRRRYRWPHLR